MKIKDLKFVTVGQKQGIIGNAAFIAENTKLNAACSLDPLGVKIGVNKNSQVIPSAKIDSEDLVTINSKSYMLFTKEYDKEKVKKVFAEHYASILAKEIKGKMEMLDFWEDIAEPKSKIITKL